MRAADARLLVPALAAWVAVAAGLALPPTVLAVAAAVAAGLALTASHPRHRHASLALTGLVVCLALACTAGHAAVRTAGPLDEWAQERAAVTLHGHVVGEPRRLRASETGPDRVAVVVRVAEVGGRGQTARIRAPVLVVGDTSWLTVGWRTRVELRGRLGPAEPADDVVALVRARGSPVVRERPGPVVAGAEVLRQGLRMAVSDLPEDAAGLVPGLVIGDRSATPPDLADAMTQTGMSHLTAVSGTNVALVGGAALLVCRGVGAPRRLRPAIALLVIAGFVVLARPDPSVVRAAVMGTIGLVGMARSRPGAGLPALGGAIVVLLAVDPWLARSYGFALSALATLGLLVLARPWARRWRAWLPGWFADALAVPVAAQVACAPVVVLLQGDVTLVGVAANLLAAPLVAPTTIGGVALCAVGPILPDLARALAWAPGLPALGVAQIARHAAAVPFGSAPWPDGIPGALALAGLTLVLLVAWSVLGRAVLAHPLVTLTLVLAAVVLLWPIRPRDWPGPSPALVACDVGQGDALVLPTRPGHGVLVDVGPDPDAVDACLRALRIDVVDAVVLTHFDTDHIGGLDGVGRGRTVGGVVTSIHPGRPSAQARVERWWRATGLRPIRVSDGDVLRWAGVRAVVRNPPARTGEGTSPNRGSIVLDVTSPGDGGPVRSLLLADADEEAGAAVRSRLRRSGSSPFDVVKVAHHGSADHDGALLDEAEADVALISVGADNDYGHPAPSVMRRIAEAGTTIHRTDRSGHIAVGRRDGRLYVAVTGRG